VAKLLEISKQIRRLEQGQALVEYGLILAVIAIAALVSLSVTGGGIDGLYGTIRQVAEAMAARLA